MSIKVEHQFIGKEFYNPNWGITHLFIGTFNPSGGEQVNYYYGRNKNRAWDLLSEIFKVKLAPDNAAEFFQILEAKHIACLDLIEAVEVIDKDDCNDKVIKGYTDSAIINKSKAKRFYNTCIILDVIKRNPGVKIYSTWGKGPTLKEWRYEVSKLDNLIQLVSPSMLARVPRGTEKYRNMLNDWNQKINVCCI